MRLLYPIYIICALLGSSLLAGAQEPASSPTPAIVVTPIPLPEIATQLEVSTGQLRTITEAHEDTNLVTNINADLATLQRDIVTREAESRAVTKAQPSLETLRQMELSWIRTRDILDQWNAKLLNQMAEIDGNLAIVIKAKSTWKETVSPAQTSSVPREVIQRMQLVLRTAEQTESLLEKRRGEILSTQNKIAGVRTQVVQSVETIRLARETMVSDVLVRESKPIWSGEISVQQSFSDARASLGTQVRELATYLYRYRTGVLVHFLLFLTLLMVFASMKRRVLASSGRLGDQAMAIIDVPLASALLTSILISGWIYPQPPRIFWAIFSVSGLIPTVIILRRLIESYLAPILYLLVGFYLVDQVRLITASSYEISRIIFLVEMFFAVIFSLWFLLKTQQRFRGQTENLSTWKLLKRGGILAIALFSVAFLANCIGFVTLATLIGDSALGSAYLALMLYAAMQILESVVTGNLRVGPLKLLIPLDRYRPMLWGKHKRILRIGLIVIWILYTLDLLTVRVFLTNWVTELLNARAQLGSVSVSLGDVVTFLITLWAGVLLSRVTRFVLEEEVYQRFQLSRGVPYAVSTTVHYAIVIAAFFFAVAALGYDLTKLTIVAGALSVGLGFGLQNIVNNFISGLILLFERPVKVGDVLQIGDQTGEVIRIGIRASAIRTSQGAELIVPNGKLISDPVTNWTHSQRQRGIDVTVAIMQGTDPQRVIAILERVAQTHPLVGRSPAPQAFLTKIGPGPLLFELRAYTSKLDEWAKVRSELHVAIIQALIQEGITVQ